MSRALHDAMTARDEYTQPCYEIAKTMAQETRLTFAEAYDTVRRDRCDTRREQGGEGMSATDDRPDFLMHNVAPNDERWVMECSVKVEKVEIHGGERTQRTAEFNGYAGKDVVGKMLDLLKEVVA